MSRIRALVTALLLGPLLVGSASRADAATFIVTNTNTSGAGSLSKAITDANLTTDPDVIEFDIPGAPLTKTIGGTLPAITQPLTIDGYTQAGAVKNTIPSGSTNAVIRIELDASGIGLGGIMIAVTNESTTLKGIAIKNIPVKAIGIDASGESSVSVRGCFIGTDASGLVDSSSGTGISVRSIASIGGGGFADRTLVSGHAGAGILMRGVAMSMLNSLVGTNAAGAAVLGNGTGLLFSSSQLISSIGGSSAEQQNVFAGNDGAGIRLGVAAVGNVSIGANSFVGNAGLAIDLLGDGVTANDEGDLDDGPNGLQNFPVLTFARANAATLTVEGYLESRPGTYRVSFYRSAAADPSGFGEGEKFVQTIEVEIPEGESGVSFREEFLVGLGLSSTPFVAATAENVAEASSSEFSEALEVIQGGQELVVTNTADSGPGSLHQAVLEANVGLDTNTIVFDLAVDEPRVIKPTAMFALNAPVVIDGYSQPGSSVNTLAQGTNAHPGVVIDGSSLGENSKFALAIRSRDVVVRGLVVRDSTAIGIGVQDTDSGQGIRIEGCFVGTDATGMLKAANARNGISLTGSAGIVVGGPHPSQRNIVSGNAINGIIDGSNGALILNNIVGGDATGEGNLGNVARGIEVTGSNSIVGSEDPTLGNVVRANGSAGVLVNNGNGHRILNNTIVGNGGLGIDLIPAESEKLGVNLNDIDDVDVGPNGGQNFPEILDTSVLPGSLKIDGRLDVPAAAVDATYTLRFYANTFCDASGNGEGQFFVGQADVLLSDNDDGFLVELPVDFDESLALTATATDVALGNTSEFSACFGGLPALEVCGDASDDGNISAPDALLTLKAAVGIGQCDDCRCDVNTQNGITAADALLLLRLAVGQEVGLQCVPCV